MKHHYLIDYENVHEDGLTGLNAIEDDAVIHIFYSDRARKLDLDSFREGQILQIQVLKVPVGKQSLDMQLVSYMGYLMGREAGEGNCYIIISKDNGYLNSIPFWRQVMHDGTTVEVRPQIRPQSAEERKTQKNPLREDNAAVSDSTQRVQKQARTLKSKPAVSAAEKPEPDEADPIPASRQEKNERRTRGRSRGRNRREKLQDTGVLSAAGVNSPTPEAQTPEPSADAAASSHQTAADITSDSSNTETGTADSVVSSHQAAAAIAADRNSIETNTEDSSVSSHQAVTAVTADNDSNSTEAGTADAAVSSEQPAVTTAADSHSTEAGTADAAASSEQPAAAITADSNSTEAKTADAAASFEQPAAAITADGNSTEAKTADAAASSEQPAAATAADGNSTGTITADTAVSSDQDAASTSADSHSAEPQTTAKASAAAAPEAASGSDDSAAPNGTAVSEMTADTELPAGDETREKPSAPRRKTRSAGKTKSTAAKGKQKKAPRDTAAPEKALDRSALNTAVMQTLSRSNVDASTTGKISSIVMKHAAEEQNKTKIYREIIRTLGQKEGLAVYNYIKSLL